MKDLIQEGRKIQETFKKNVNELEQPSMFDAEFKEFDILGQKCPICEKGKIEEKNMWGELACNYKGPGAECRAGYAERYPLEKYWKEFIQKMKSIPKDKTDPSIINFNRRKVYRDEFMFKLEKKS